MRGMAAGVLVVLGGCTSSVRMVHRNDCWVRQTQRWNQLTEELGPCSRPAPEWAEDRATRMVQECLAQADYRWQTQATAAWNRMEMWPSLDSDKVLAACVQEAAHASGDGEVLRERLSQLDEQRRTLESRAEEDRRALRQSHERLSDQLAEAARRPAPPAQVTATATATSDGRASNDSGTQVSTLPQAPTLPAPTLAAPVVCRPASGVNQALSRAKPDCQPVPPTGHTATAKEASPADKETSPLAGPPGAEEGQ